MFCLYDCMCTVCVCVLPTEVRSITWALGSEPGCSTVNLLSQCFSPLSINMVFYKQGKGDSAARREGERGGIKGEERRQGGGSERTVSAGPKLRY